MFQIQNNSVEDVNPIIDILNQFIPYSQKKLGFNKPVSLFLQSDEENANKILGKTAFYNPTEFSVTVFTSGRHPKDILRSLSHELVHHAQNCRGDFEGNHVAGEGYAQKDPHMRNMELEAYEKGNIIFRDFEDLIKADEININLSGESQMSLKEWRDNELNTLLMKKWGFSSKEKLEEKKEEDSEKMGSSGTGAPSEEDDEEGNRPSMAKDMDLKEQEKEEKSDSEDEEKKDDEVGSALLDAAGRPEYKKKVKDLVSKAGKLSPEVQAALKASNEGHSAPENSLTISEAKEVARRIFMKLSEQGVSQKARKADDVATAGHARRRDASRKGRGSEAAQKSVSEGCPDLEGDEMEIGIIGPEMGMEAEVPDLSDLTPDEAFGAGWAAAAQAIEDALAKAPHEAEEAGEEEGLQEGDFIQRLMSFLPGGPTPKEFSKVLKRDKEDVERQKAERGQEKVYGKSRIQKAMDIADEPLQQQESLSIDETKAIAKKIFEKILSGQRINEQDDNDADVEEWHREPAKAPKTPPSVKRNVRKQRRKERVAARQASAAERKAGRQEKAAARKERTQDWPRRASKAITPRDVGKPTATASAGDDPWQREGGGPATLRPEDEEIGVGPPSAEQTQAAQEEADPLGTALASAGAKDPHERPGEEIEWTRTSGPGTSMPSK